MVTEENSGAMRVRVGELHAGELGAHLGREQCAVAGVDVAAERPGQECASAGRQHDGAGAHPIRLVAPAAGAPPRRPPRRRRRQATRAPDCGRGFEHRRARTRSHAAHVLRALQPVAQLVAVRTDGERKARRNGQLVEPLVRLVEDPFRPASIGEIATELLAARDRGLPLQRVGRHVPDARACRRGRAAGAAVALVASTTSAPSRAAVNAAQVAAGPPPTTKTSAVGSSISVKTTPYACRDGSTPQATNFAAVPEPRHQPAGRVRRREPMLAPTLRVAHRGTSAIIGDDAPVRHAQAKAGPQAVQRAVEILGVFSEAEPALSLDVHLRSHGAAGEHCLPTGPSAAAQRIARAHRRRSQLSNRFWSRRARRPRHAPTECASACATAAFSGRRHRDHRQFRRRAGRGRAHAALRTTGDSVLRSPAAGFTTTAGAQRDGDGRAGIQTSSDGAGTGVGPPPGVCGRLRPTGRPRQGDRCPCDGPGRRRVGRGRRPGIAAPAHR